MKREKSCGAIILRDDTLPLKVLLIKHKAGGHWSFPKGHVEHQETEEETAIREVFEETGLNINLDTELRLSVKYNTKKDTLKQVVYFFALADAYKVTLQESEILESVWVSIDEVENYLTFNNDKMLINKTVEFYNKKYI